MDIERLLEELRYYRSLNYTNSEILERMEMILRRIEQLSQQKILSSKEWLGWQSGGARELVSKGRLNVIAAAKKIDSRLAEYFIAQA